MAQEQKYTVVDKHDGYEVRHYPSCVVAQVKVSGDFDSAGSHAFGSLFRFISGGNEASKKISMTAPVIQQSSQSTRLQAWDEHVVSFVMPAEMTMEDTPTPTNGDVHIRQVSDQLVAALRFSGGMNVSDFESNTRKLAQFLVRDGYIQTDVARIARFNAPWTPGFMRRNEIQIPVVAAKK